MKLSYSLTKRRGRLSTHRGKIWDSAYYVKQTGGELLIEFRTRVEKLLADAIEKSRLASEETKRMNQLFYKDLVSRYRCGQTAKKDLYHSVRVEELKRLLELINN